VNHTAIASDGPLARPIAHPLLADVVFSSRTAGRPRVVTDALLIVGASLLMAACARIVIPLPFTPAPVTGQTFAVLLTGVVLGMRRGFLATLLYLMEGAVGLPFFANGASGIAPFFGPTVGYLVAFPFAAALTGFLSERGFDRRPLTAALAMFAGSLLILVVGSLCLSLFVGGIAKGFLLGMLPFVPGDLIKTALATIALPSCWHYLQRLEK